MNRTPILIIADSDHDADMLYASGIFVPDPFILVRQRGQTHLVMSDLEMDRARRECPQAKVHSLSQLRQTTLDQGVRQPTLGDIARTLLAQLRIRRVDVPLNFPLSHALILQAAPNGLTLRPRDLFPERAIKSEDEIRKIKTILKTTADGLQAGIDLIRKASPRKNGDLIYRKHRLTAEAVRGAIHTEIARQGGIPSNTIVAGGDQGCDPHERGHGPLPAHRPIILDVFPRSETTGYFGDMTRTVVRGKATEAVHQQYAAVGKAQKTAIQLIRDGANARSIHRAVQDRFKSLGYQTQQRDGHMEGFFHGTGHGLGLEIHESPGIGSITKDTLKTGHVVTVEPGLYYPGIGGVRLEDVVVVEDTRARKLTRLPHVLEI